MTLNLPVVTHFALRATGTLHAVALGRNMCGVLSAGAVLYFVSSATGNRRLRGVLWFLLGGTVAALLVLDRAAPPHQGHGVPFGGPPIPSTAYWLVMIAAHLTADVSCAWLCRQYARRADNRSLRLSLKAFGAGTALAGACWFCQLLHSTLQIQGPLPFLPFAMGLHGVVRTVALLMPSFVAARRNVAEIATIRRLWPLWYDLVQAVPCVAFMKPRRRVLEILWPRVSWQLLAYRKIIEARDAILALRDCDEPPGMDTGPPPRTTARRSSPAPSVTSPTRSSACSACRARTASAAGRARPRSRPASGWPPRRGTQPHPPPGPGPGGGCGGWRQPVSSGRGACRGGPSPRRSRCRPRGSAGR
ncbi:DUF6545 domain-containing protein [Streptomyces sp. NPDC053560]|uniref:DUF6545 domain-containing protein n=1 Tax=Streptomyces sp. NPDC053560 TaxID=3365711 RepID=UPI0037CFF553